METCADRLDVDEIREAYELAVEAHAGQRWTLGEEYAFHTVEVATILARQRVTSQRAMVSRGLRGVGSRGTQGEPGTQVPSHGGSRMNTTFGELHSAEDTRDKARRVVGL